MRIARWTWQAPWGKCNFGIAALRTGKLIAPFQYERVMSGLLFESRFEKTLLTTCPKRTSASWKMPFHKKKVVYPIAKKSSHPLDAVFAGIQSHRALMERVEAKRCKSNPSLQLCRQLPLASWKRRPIKLNHSDKIPVPPNLIYSNLQENTLDFRRWLPEARAFMLLMQAVWLRMPLVS